MTAFLITAALLFVPTQGIVSEVSDSAITTSIETQIGLDPHVPAFSIHTKTVEGVVTLSGRVEDEEQKAAAEKIARGVNGVTDVVNKLTVIPTTITEKQERDFKQVAADKQVSSAIRSRMVYNREMKGMKIGVDVVNGHVILHGVVNSEEQRDHLAKIAANTKGAESVTNDLIVRVKQKKGFIGGLGRDLGDEWLEKKIETAIVATRKLSIRAMDVEIDDGICYLTGVVENEEIKMVAGDIAEGYTGVQEVVNAISVREGGVDLPPAPKKGKTRRPVDESPDRKLGTAQRPMVDESEGTDVERKSKQKAKAVEEKAEEEVDVEMEDDALEPIEVDDELAPAIEERTLEAPR